MATGPPLLRLYPSPCRSMPIEGLYLRQEIRQREGPGGLPFVYTNFIASLDGRIALPDPGTGLHAVPAAMVNPRDTALYLELAAHADLLLTTGRHLRALAAGRYHEIIQLQAHPQIAAWRRARGLAPRPAIAAISAGALIPLAELRARYDGPLLLIAAADAPPARVEALRAAGVDVEQLPPGAALDGQAVARMLAARGHRHVYSVAGPRVFHALLASGALSRLYLTLAHLALGGRDYDALTLGESLSPPVRFRLHQLYLDPQCPHGAGQLLASFDCVH